MSVGLYLFLTLDVQWAACGSVAADRVSLRCSQTHEAFCFYSVWFHFVFRVMSFFFFWSCDLSFKRQPSKEKKNQASVRREQKQEVIHRQSNLVWWDIRVILSDQPPSALTLWQIVELAQRPAACVCVCVLGLTCQRGGLKSSPRAPAGTHHSPQAHISWHFPWQHAVNSALSAAAGEGMIAKVPSKTVFPWPDRFVWCLSVCVCVFTSCWTLNLSF